MLLVLQNMTIVDFEKLDSDLGVKSGTTLGHLKKVKLEIESVLIAHKSEHNGLFPKIKIINKITKEIGKRIKILSHQNILR